MYIAAAIQGAAGSLKAPLMPTRKKTNIGGGGELSEPFNWFSLSRLESVDGVGALRQT